MENSSLINSPRFLILFIILAISLCFFSPISAYQSKDNKLEANKEFEFDAKEGEYSDRTQRAVVELNGLLNKRTKYTAATLGVGKYGNWCGTQDGSGDSGKVKDGCDQCCKAHKLCYKKAKTIIVSDFLGIELHCIPFAKVYSVTNDLLHPDCVPIETIDKECSLAACKCDLVFVQCLREEPCPTF